MLADNMEYGAQADFVTNDQLRLLAAAADQNGGVLPRASDFVATPDITEDDLTMQRVIVPGRRLDPQAQEDWYKYQMRASMADFGRDQPIRGTRWIAPISSNSLNAWNTVSDVGIQRAASRLGVPVAAIRTVAEVETRGGGFIAPGKPAILFERHKFSTLTANEFDANYSEISNPDAGGYGKSGEHQYDRLNLAMTLNSSAALKSASWGQFQIMGMNYKQAGFSSVESFVSANQESSDRQLDSLVSFIENDSKLLGALQKQDWAAFAKRYNGKNYRINDYDTKLKNAYEKFNR